MILESIQVLVFFIWQDAIDRYLVDEIVVLHRTDEVDDRFGSQLVIGSHALKNEFLDLLVDFELVKEESLVLEIFCVP